MLAMTKIQNERHSSTDPTVSCFNGGFMSSIGVAGGSGGARCCVRSWSEESLPSLLIKVTKE
jgi:hypothetical protein